MCKLGFSLITAAVAMILTSTTSAQLRIRVSVKLLYDDRASLPDAPIPPGGDVNPRDGHIDPGHCGYLPQSAISCDQEILEKFDYVNQVLARLGRGYTFDPPEIVHLTDPPDPPPALGVSTWTQAQPDAALDFLDAAAQADPVGFAYRADAINVYVFDVPAGGIAHNTHTSASNRVVTTSQGEGGSWPRFLHEIGHYLGLNHTHGLNGTGLQCDGVCDTLEDDESFSTRDDIAHWNFGMNFLSLTCLQQDQVLDVFYNVMAYHADNGQTYDCQLFNPDDIQCNDATTTSCRYRLTVDQLDKMSNRLNNLATIGVVSGRTVFVAKTHTPCTGVGTEMCNPCSCDPAPRDINGVDVVPPTTVAGGLALTGTDTKHDVLLIRGAANVTTAYNETMTIAQPVTLRATRGVVKIGVP